MLLPGDVRLGLHATHAPDPLHTGVVPPQWALVVHWAGAQEPSTRQNRVAGHEPCTALSWPGVHAMHVPLEHTGATPPH